MEDHWNKEIKDAVWNNRPELIKLVIEQGAKPQLDRFWVHGANSALRGYFSWAVRCCEVLTGSRC